MCLEARGTTMPHLANVESRNDLALLREKKQKRKIMSIYSCMAYKHVIWLPKQTAGVPQNHQCGQASDPGKSY
jgi:hypothetical protein